MIWPPNYIITFLKTPKNGVAYEAKVLYLTTNFSEILCGSRSWGKLCSVLSKDLDWKSGSPRYWHLKNSHEASAVWSKILNWWPNFDETLCGKSLCSKYISVLSKVVIKMNRTPRYWHLKIKKMAYEASGLWSKKS